jgi:hypothetical protein
MRMVKFTVSDLLLLVLALTDVRQGPELSAGLAELVAG